MTEFITRNYGQKEFEVIIKTDNKDHYKATEDFARKLIDHAKPLTNADRIRAMSDEELAESLSKTVVDAVCYLPLGRKTVDKTPKEMWEDLVKEYLQWLKQPVEVEDGQA